MTPKPLNWFKERIGKRVYRTKSTCTCEICKNVFENGLIISDELHAHYLYDCQNELRLVYEDKKIDR